MSTQPESPRRKIARGLQNAAMPIFYLVATFVLVGVWRILDWPQGDELIKLVRGLFAQYGIWFVLVSAILEGLVLVNIYVPCSFVIVMAVILARGDPLRAALSVVATQCGFLLSSFVNYGIGILGLAPLIEKFPAGASLTKRAEAWQMKWGAMAIGLSYWHPNFGAFAAVNAGKGRVPFPLFLKWVIPAIVAWNTLFGLLFYFFAPRAEAAASSTPILFVQAIFGVWATTAFLLGFFRASSRK